MDVYLAVSLIFVITTLLEFALVLFLKQKLEMQNGKSKISELNLDIIHVDQMENNLTSDGNLEVTTVSSNEQSISGINETPSRMSLDNVNNGLSCRSYSIPTRIDTIMSWLFALSYLAFNFIYWYIY